VPLVMLTIFFGFYPAPVLNVFAASVDQLMSELTPATDAAALRPPEVLQLTQQ
jgi:NADH-quinone oxidoreductase subunit M